MKSISKLGIEGDVLIKGIPKKPTGNIIVN